MDKDCLFCKIAAKDISASIVYEDSHVIAFLDISQRAPGHTMVISKRHSSTLIDLPDEEIAPLFSVVKTIATVLSDKLDPDGITIGINQGKASGQEVDHLHVHLMPRWIGDGGGSVQSIVNNPPKESSEEILKKIKG